MRLTLNKFRQHKNLTINLSESGLLMLKGKSGNGKTTVFDAIFEALYGEADDVVPWGESHCSVELEFNKPKYLNIKRTRGPYTLVVTDETGKVAKDDEGQMIINQVMGMSSHEFLACSYIQQGMYGSLLTLPPSDQLKFIQQLSIGLADPEKIKKSLDNIIKTEKILIDHIGIDNENTSKLLLELEKTLSSNETKLNSIIIPLITDNHLNVSDQLNKKSLESQDLNKKFNNINKLLSSDIYELISRIPEMENGLELLRTSSLLKIHNNNVNITDITNNIDMMNKKNSQNTLYALKEKREILNNINKMKELALLVNEKYPESKEFKKITEYFDAIIINYEQNISVLKDSLSRTQKTLNELQSINTPQLCPECKTHLVIINDNICKPEMVIDNLEEKKNQLIIEFNHLKHKIFCNSEELNDIKKLKNQTDILKSKVIGDKMPEIKDLATIEKMENEANNTIKSTQDLLISIAELKKENNLLTTELTSNQNTLDRVISKREEAIKSGLKSKEDMIIDRDKLSDQIDKLNNDIQELSVLSKEYSNYLITKNTHDLVIKGINNCTENIKTVINRTNELKIKLNKSIERVAAATRAKEINDFASLSAIELIVDQINQNAEEYLEKMFPEDGTKILLKNVSMTKKGDERAKVSIDIFHKGKNAKKLNSLSGGEKSRACLAFQLAVSDLYKSPILLIDEGFAGLDDASKQECMEILKDVTTDKLVIVIEHGASEAMFDEVIDI